jgi:hypothetical protein
MIAGISLQVVSMAIAFLDLRSTKMFRGFLWAFGVAVVTIFIRSVFLIAELSGGLNGPVFNQQVTLMALEGGMMSIATIDLVAFRWAEAKWTLREKKETGLDES